MSNTQIYVQVVGKDSADSTPSFLLFFDNKRYMFNCGEGTQRFCMENKIKLTRLSDLFLTRLHSRVIGGVPGMLLTLDGVGAKSLNIHGPTGTSDLVNTIRLTAHLRSTFPVTPIEYADPVSILQLDNAKVSIINLAPRDKFHKQDSEEDKLDSDHETPSKKARIEPTCPSPSIFCYIIQGNPIAGKFDPKRATELGVQKGPLFGQLKSGKPVPNKDGVMVDPSECVGPSIPGSVVILVDCPSVGYFESIKECTAISEHFQNEFVCAVIHITPSDLISTQEYQHWMEKFHKSCNASATLLKKLNFIDPDVFPSLIYADSNSFVTEGFPTSRVVAAKNLMKIMMYPPNLIGIDTTKVPIDPTQSDISKEMEAYNELEFQERLNAYQSKRLQLSRDEEAKASDADDFKILFLGTGSAIPSKYRNVTGIYLKYNSGFSALLDAGEGTLGQLNRRFGVDEGLKLISNLSCIFVSHIHADHNIGVARILQTRYEYLKSQGQESAPPLAVIGPPLIASWLARMQSIIGPLGYKFIDAKEFISGENEWVNAVAKPLGLDEVKTTLVPHCRLSYAILFKHKASKGVLYSGDTAYCQDLIDFGKGIDILIHEATFEDELKEEAIKKRHSTISEAIEVGRLMDAKFTILTHFSQRYPKIPVFSDETHGSNRIAVAFDLMDVSGSTLNQLPYILPCIQSLFVDDEDAQESEA